MIRFKPKKRSMPRYTGPSPEQAAAEARAKAAEEAAKVAQANTKLMAEMNAKLAAASAKKATPYAPTTKVRAMMGDVGGGVGRQRDFAKRKRAVDASRLRIKLNPGAAAAVSGGASGGTAGAANP
jgi:Tfp pilus assembly protein PilV